MTRRHVLAVPLEEIPFVLRLADLTPPLSWPAVFGRPGRVELEIGCGKGLFLSAASRLQPDSNFLGIERAGKYFHRAVERLAKAPAPGVRLVQTDAFDFLDRWVVPGSVDVVHVYFPDPWPKKRHARRRLLQPELFRLIERVLCAEGTLCLASDVEWYFKETMAELEGRSALRGLPWPDDAPDRIPTSYAVKYAKEGRALHYAKFLRTGPADG